MLTKSRDFVVADRGQISAVRNREIMLLGASNKDVYIAVRWLRIGAMQQEKFVVLVIISRWREQCMRLEWRGHR